jgi:hypothetical protein
MWLEYLPARWIIRVFHGLADFDGYRRNLKYRRFESGWHGVPHMHQTLAIVGVLVFGMLAGCVGAQSAKPDAVAQPSGAVNEELGGVSGNVVTDELVPIAGAQVGIASLGLVTVTDANGAFQLGGIAPGQHAVSAIALGYTSASLTTNVEAGRVAEGLQFILVALPVQGPHHTIHYLRLMIDGEMVKATPDCLVVSSGVKTCVGGSSCSASAPDGCMTEVGYGHCGDDPDWGDFGCDFDPSWQTIVGEVMWTPSSSVTGRGFLYEIMAPNVSRDEPHGGRVNQADPRDFMHLDSEAPIRTWIDREVLAGAKEPWQGAGTRTIKEEDWCGGVADAIVEGKCDWHWRLFPAWCTVHGITGGAAGCDKTGPDFAVMQDQSVDVYFTYFVIDPAPADWSALPDA